MVESHASVSASPVSRFQVWRRRRWVIAVASVLALPLLALLVMSFLPSGWGGLPKIELQAGKIEARNNHSSSSSVSAGRHARLGLDRVAVICSSDHPLMRRVTAAVVQRLDALPVVGSVELVTLGEGEDGGRLHDFYITLDLSRLDTSGVVLTGRTVDATVVTTAGQDLFDSHHGYTDELTPPLARVHYEGTLEHHSVTTGYESADARFKLAADNIAEQIAGSLQQNLGKWSGEYCRLGAMPAGLTPPYRPVPTDLPLPDDPGLTRGFSGSGLMLHNRTVWTMTTDQPLAVLRDLRDRLAAQGWRVPLEDELKSDDWQHHFRAARGTGVYEAYEIGQRDQRQPGAAVRLAIEYGDRMTREEFAPIFDALLADDSTPLDTLLVFQRSMSQDHHERLMQKLLAAAHLPADAQLQVARYLHGKKRDDEAMARLRGAHLVARVSDDGNTDEIEKLAKEITGQKDWRPTPPDDAELAAMGIAVLTPGSTATAEVGLNQPAIFCQRIDDTASGLAPLQSVSVTIEPATIPEGVYTIRLSHHGWTGGKSSSTSTPHHPPSPWRGECATGHNSLDWYAQAEEAAPERYLVTLRAGRSD